RDAYERYRRSDGLLPATCEVIYGHAWGSRSKPLPAQAGEPAIFPLSRLRRRSQESG
ncbi:MAG: hypothetical protein IAF00_11005, partial [Phycisphaerales bacterium]|nr:hypothetical protein [Phycisphaerales bacterium]